MGTASGVLLSLEKRMPKGDAAIAPTIISKRRRISTTTPPPAAKSPLTAALTVCTMAFAAAAARCPSWRAPLWVGPADCMTIFRCHLRCTACRAFCVAFAAAPLIGSSIFPLTVVFTVRCLWAAAPGWLWRVLICGRSTLPGVTAACSTREAAPWPSNTRCATWRFFTASRTAFFRPCSSGTYCGECGG